MSATTKDEAVHSNWPNHDDETEKELTPHLRPENTFRARVAGQEHVARRDDDDPPPRSLWRRWGLLLFMVLGIWVAYRVRNPPQLQPKVVYASRYSKEHKYRPAASPIITQRLKDGRVRIKGAAPAELGR